MVGNCCICKNDCVEKILSFAPYQTPFVTEISEERTDDKFLHRFQRGEARWKKR